MDITPLIRDYIDQMDGRVEDLSYNLEGIVDCYNKYRHTKTAGNEWIAFSEMLVKQGYVKNLDDAQILAQRALLGLYPDIADQISKHGYIGGIVHAVRLHVTRDKRRVSCAVLMKVI